MTDLIEQLSWRGFIHQATDLDGLKEAAQQPLTAYIGFDCTAESLHVGSLIQIRVLHWLAKTGNTPICVLGSATTQIGDPTGKDTARPMLSQQVIESNMRSIEAVIRRLVPETKFVQNSDWFGADLSFINFMRTFGPHFSVNRLLTLDVFSRRLSENKSLSFLEFVYPLMQAVDFLELNRRFGVCLQVGGSDQWGNIVGGTELIRKEGRQAFGLTTPLLVNSSGEKMGKTAGGQTIWLAPHLTSPFDFWQFWRNIEDNRAEAFMALMTDFEGDVIDHGFGVNGPGINQMKKLLATEVTAFVHGREIAEECERRAERVFENGNTDALEPVVVPFTEQTVADILVTVGLTKSRGEADRLVKNGGVRMDGVQIANARSLAPQGEFVLAVGRKRFVRVQHV